MSGKNTIRFGANDDMLVSAWWVDCRDRELSTLKNILATERCPFYLRWGSIELQACITN